MRIANVAVVGAGNMGSGIAQKIATEGVPVILVDSTREKAEAGKQRIEKLLIEGLERQIFTGADVDAILARVTPTHDVGKTQAADLVIEAVFEDLDVKRQVFADLGRHARPDALLATNTSSFLVADVAAVTRNAERVVGLHYFYHPAKNRLVEVIGHGGSNPAALRAAWRFQERVGKTPIASSDAPGFVVNRFFVPWLNEAVRLHEEGIDVATIESVAKQSFGIGMGPFELMNVTGIPITLHAAKALAKRLGAFYAPASSIAMQVANNTPWDVSGHADLGKAAHIADRLWGVVLHIALALTSEGVGTPEDVDIGARVGLRWPLGPFEMMNGFGVDKTVELCRAIEERYQLPQPKRLAEQKKRGGLFALERVRLTVEDGIATVLVNRPDQLNALDPQTVEQLEARFIEAEGRADVRAIVLAGAGKAFVAGADVKYFVDKLKQRQVADIVAFATRGQKLFRRIEKSQKRVICRLDGMALGGGAELVLACHAAVATTRASLGFPETGIGIYPGLGGTQRLTRRVGKGLARFYIYTGNVLGAADLARLGLVWKVVPPDELDDALREAVHAAPVQARADAKALTPDMLDAARFVGTVPVNGLIDGSLTLPGGSAVTDLAKKVRRKAPGALRRVAELTELAEKSDIDAGLEAETAGLSAIFSHPHALEGMNALLEKRRASFT